MTNYNQADFIFTATKEGHLTRKFFLLAEKLQEATDLYMNDGWIVNAQLK